MTSTRDRIAHALALEFYRGEFRQKTADKQWLKLYTAGIKVGTTLAMQYAEEQAQHMAKQFWRYWETDADLLLTGTTP
jgi:hypothetical protein